MFPQFRVSWCEQPEVGSEIFLGSTKSRHWKGIVGAEMCCPCLSFRPVAALQDTRSGLCECATHTLKPGQPCLLHTHLAPAYVLISHVCITQVDITYYSKALLPTIYIDPSRIAPILGEANNNPPKKKNPPQQIIQSRTSENHFPQVNPPTLIRNPLLQLILYY